jgi:hypothetical protein
MVAHLMGWPTRWWNTLELLKISLNLDDHIVHPAQYFTYTTKFSYIIMIALDFICHRDTNTNYTVRVTL